MPVLKIEKTIRTKILNIIFYSLEGFLLKGPFFHLLLFSGVIAGVSVVGGLSVWYFSDFPSAPDAIWWAFLRLTDPGYLGDDKGVLNRIVSTVLTVLGYILFMGTLIAAMNQSLNIFIKKLESGITVVKDSGHILLLGLNEKAVLITKEIFSSQNRLEKYLSLKGLSKKDLHLVYLADQLNAASRAHLKHSLQHLWNKGKISLRSGSPLNAMDLDRVSFASASTIILPAPTQISKEPEIMDSHVLKTLLSFQSMMDAKDFHKLSIVAEVIDPRRTRLVDEIFPENVHAISTAAIMSRIFAQSLKQKGIAAAYSNLLTNLEGPSIKIKSFDMSVGKCFGELYKSTTNETILGILDNFGTVSLVPKEDKIIGKGDQIISISLNRRVKTAGKNPTFLNRNQHEKPPLKFNKNSENPKNVYIFGWSNKAIYFLEEFSKENLTPDTQVTIISKVSTEIRKLDIKELGKSGSNLDFVRHIETDYTIPTLLHDLNWETCTHILFLASDQLRVGEDADSRTLLGFNLVKRILNNKRLNPLFVIELLNEENYTLVDHQVAEVLVSPRITAHILSSIALKPELEPIFDCLFEARGCHLSVAEVAYDVDFGSIRQSMPIKNGIPIGLLNAESCEINMNPQDHDIAKKSSHVITLTGTATLTSSS